MAMDEEREANLPQTKPGFLSHPTAQGSRKIPSPSHMVDELNPPRRAEIPRTQHQSFSISLFLRAPNFMQWMLYGRICAFIPLQGCHRPYSPCQITHILVAAFGAQRLQC